MAGTSMGTSSPQISHYTKVLPVSIRKDGNIGMFTPNNENVPPSNLNQGVLQSSSEQREFIRVTLAYPSQSYGTMNPHKEIVLRLTNDDNPLFYYHLKVTEAEFPNLRLQQGLLVDFYGFPGQLVSLLDRCDPNALNQKDAEDTSSGLKSSCFGNGPKFLLVLKVTGGNTVLDIVESNPFKYLCHLSLHINPGTDGEVKKFLCEVTTSIKKDYKLLEEKYNHLSTTMEGELVRVKSLYENKCSELNQLREEAHSQSSLLTTKHFQDMTEEKEKLIKLQSELVAKFDSEKAEIDKNNKQALKALQNRIATLESENQSLSLVKANQESALQDATSRLKMCGEELKKLQQELATLREQNSRLDYDYHQMRLKKIECQREIQTLRKELKKNEDLINKHNDTIISLSCDKKKLEEQRVESVKELEKAKSSCKTQTSELVKANEIIKKFQDDIRSCHAKCKLQAAAAVEYERIIKEQTSKIEQLETEVSELKENFKVTCDSLSAKTTEADELSKKVQDYEAKVNSNENMITWLNKQLNELQGLSDLNKFRVNLGMPNKNDLKASEQAITGNRTASGTGGGAGTGRLAPRPPLTNTINHISDTSNQNVQNTNGNMGHAGVHPHNHTLPSGGSPSWLHIYQSTGTGNHTDMDLSSRLEHVSALGAILNSQSQLNSSRQRETEFREEHENSGNRNFGKVPPKPIKSNLNSLDAATGSAGKQPSWAKSRHKVTLESVTNNKPTNAVWKNK